MTFTDRICYLVVLLALLYLAWHIGRAWRAW